MALPQLARTTKLSRYVTRVLESNASPFTLQGTNTYLVGDKRNYILLDTGEGREDYIDHLTEALENNGPHATITDIIFSHWHKDHIRGIANILRFLKEVRHQTVLPKLHKWITGSEEQQLFDILEENHMHDYITPPQDPNVDKYLNPLTENQRFSISDKAFLQVIKTPGHTNDSISLLLDDESDRFIFTFDTILGHGTTIFTDLSKYMNSLNGLFALLHGKNGSLYPGHGEVVKNGHELTSWYIEAREGREHQIVDSLKKSTEPLSPGDLVKLMYGPQLPERVVPAATHNVYLHLQKLLNEGRVREIHGDDETRWALVFEEKI